MTEQTTIHLLAGRRPDGQIIYEQVFAQAIGDDCYQLMTSPIFARGAARLDIIRLLTAGQFAVEQHGGNLCIRIFAKQAIASIAQALQAQFSALQGQIDYQNERMIVLSVPVAASFSEIETVLNQVLQAHGDNAQWLYANVYDPVDGQTPLNWWHDFLAK